MSCKVVKPCKAYCGVQSLRNIAVRQYNYTFFSFVIVCSIFLRSVKAVTHSMVTFPWCLVSQSSTPQSSWHAGTMSPAECLKSHPFCKLDVFPSIETKRKNSPTNHVERSSNQRLLSFEIPVAAFACCS